MNILKNAKDILIKDGRIPFIIADTGPLIHLVGSGMIQDVINVCSVVIIPDLVAIESTLKGKPFADKVEQWLNTGLIKVSQTTTGDMYRAALLGNSTFRAKDAGERAIIDWLLDTIDETPVPAIVIYENGKVPKLIQHHDMNANVSVLTTRMFMHVMQDNNLTDVTWDTVLSLFPTINPKASESHHYYFEPTP